jgi:predicted hotdog family 3-hydroxylacyl-ACP dehydratase
MKTIVTAQVRTSIKTVNLEVSMRDSRDFGVFRVHLNKDGRVTSRKPNRPTINRKK